MNEKKDINYKDTLNLPSTDFPMKAKLKQREPEIHSKWDKIRLDEAILASRSREKKYVLHDGPPYANGDIHIGHALNKILKDIIVRYKSMKGFYSPYVPGWDCHGLPIEQKVMNKLGSKAREKTPLQIRRACKEYALKWVETQSDQFRRLGIQGDFEHPYLTLNPLYETGILKAFRTLVEKGYVYRGRKPVYWCASCTTALADAEVEYEDHSSHSIYVRFPVLNKEKLPELKEIDNPSIVIWTTTPWTLPANVAITVHPRYDYVAAKIKDTGEVYILAEYLLHPFLKACELGEAEVIAKWKGDQLSGLECSHPLLDKKSVVVTGAHVTLEQGTGCVHTAPGHGYDDYIMSLEHNLPIVMPVDERGRFTEEYPDMQGVTVWQANAPITEKLKEKGLLLGSGKIEHSYPHCWRCHNPIIFRATDQWFMSVDEKDLRKKALEAIDRVKWVPKWGRNRIYNMVEMRPDWCLSRQRKWGVPIPALQCHDCKNDILDLGVIDLFLKQVEERGTDAWFEDPVESVLPDGFQCPECGGNSFEKSTDTLDVWFDSGSSHIAVCDQREELGWPVDLYLEGSDQHRGWFQSSLLVAMGVKEHEPYRTVLTHGFILDKKGEAMSKSKGNVIAPKTIMEQKGADVLRLWVTSEDYREDLKISDEILARISDAYRRIRNTFRFLLGNLGDFHPEEDAVSYDDLSEFDRWALHELAHLVKKVEKAYENFEFHKVYHFVHSFCVVQMSSLYLDVVKDRLYVEGKPSPERRSSQTVIYHLADVLVRLLAPVMCYTMEEVYQSLLTAMGKQAENPVNSDAPLTKSVHLMDFPEAPEEWSDQDLSERWERIFKIRETVVKRLEEARRRKDIGHSLDARVTLETSSDEIYQLLASYDDFLADLCIVSGFELKKTDSIEKPVSDVLPEISIKVEKAPGEKCSRCWKLHTEVGTEKKYPETCPRCAQVLEKYSSNEGS